MHRHVTAQGARELLAAARPEPRAFTADADRLVGRDAPRGGSRRKPADEHTSRADLLERSLPACGETASHQFGIESAAHSARRLPAVGLSRWTGIVRPPWSSRCTTT